VGLSGKHRQGGIVRQTQASCPEKLQPENLENSWISLEKLAGKTEKSG